MDILCGAGVGGGSLVHHDMTIQPSGRNVALSLPGLDYERFDQDSYRRVERVLRPAPIPDDLLVSPQYEAARSFAERVTRSGREPFRMPLPLDWNVARRELRGEMKPSYTAGDVLYGVNNGGKNSVDVTSAPPRRPPATGRWPPCTSCATSPTTRRAAGW